MGSQYNLKYLSKKLKIALLASPLVLMGLLVSGAYQIIQMNIEDKTAEMYLLLLGWPFVLFFIFFFVFDYIVSYCPRYKKGDVLLVRDHEKWNNPPEIEVLEVGQKRYLLKNKKTSETFEINFFNQRKYFKKKEPANVVEEVKQLESGAELKPLFKSINKEIVEEV